MATTAPSVVLVRFAEFSFDRESRTLLKDGKELRIQGQPLEILAMLLERPGQVVAREDIVRRLWPDGTFVEFEHSLNAAVRRLREALGDDSDTPRFVETVPRRGYRFIAEIEGAEDLAAIAHRRRWIVGACISAAVILVASAWLVYLLVRPAPLSERSQIVIADVVNTTGEPIFDGALKTALAVSIEESPYVEIVADERIREALKLMTRQPDEPVTGALARELCQRTNAQAALNSWIARIGGDYVVTLEAIGCGDGKVLARSQEETATKEQILGAIRGATATLRRRLGESVKSLNKFNTPLEQATTPSLEALQAFNRGVNLARVARFKEAQVFFEQAIKLDPNFAAARSSLANAKFEQGDYEGSRQDEIAAFEMRERSSERERCRIMASYHARVSLDLEKAVETLQACRTAYPDDRMIHHSLGYTYLLTGRFDECVRETREGLRLGITSVAAPNNLAFCYKALNQLDAAQHTLEEGLRKQLPVSNALFADIAAARGDMVGLEKWFQMMSARSERGQAQAMLTRAQLRASRGELRASRKEFREAMQFAKARQLGNAMAAIPNLQFTIEVRLGQTAEARNILRNNLDALSIVDLADAGAFAEADALASKQAKRFPNGTMLHAMDLPLLRAMEALHRGNSAQAIEELRPAERYDLAHWGATGLRVHDTRGYAYLAVGNPKSAAAEFQKILDHRAMAPFGITTALAQVGLARSHAAAGERDKALRDYETFLNQWKNADADIPILLQAKAEYAKLMSHP